MLQQKFQIRGHVHPVENAIRYLKECEPDAVVNVLPTKELMRRTVEVYVPQQWSSSFTERCRMLQVEIELL